jgi:hypothetical protein
VYRRGQTPRHLTPDIIVDDAERFSAAPPTALPAYSSPDAFSASHCHAERDRREAAVVSVTPRAATAARRDVAALPMTPLLRRQRRRRSPPYAARCVALPE